MRSVWTNNDEEIQIMVQTLEKCWQALYSDRRNRSTSELKTAKCSDVGAVSARLSQKSSDSTSILQGYYRKFSLIITKTKERAVEERFWNLIDKMDSFVFSHCYGRRNVETLSQRKMETTVSGVANFTKTEKVQAIFVFVSENNGLRFWDKWDRHYFR